MQATNVIIGPVVTEKAERLKAESKAYVVHVHHEATKIDVSKALEKFYDVKVAKVRIVWVRPKTRQLGASTMEKRHRSKRALVTLKDGSKALDLTAFQTR
jgi:large subunit ribosomal protein L23